MVSVSSSKRTLGSPGGTCPSAPDTAQPTASPFLLSRRAGGHAAREPHSASTRVRPAVSSSAARRAPRGSGSGRAAKLQNPRIIGSHGGGGHIPFFLGCFGFASLSEPVLLPSVKSRTDPNLRRVGDVYGLRCWAPSHSAAVKSAPLFGRSAIRVLQSLQNPGYSTSARGRLRDR